MLAPAWPYFGQNVPPVSLLSPDCRLSAQDVLPRLLHVGHVVPGQDGVGIVLVESLQWSVLSTLLTVLIASSQFQNPNPREFYAAMRIKALTNLPAAVGRAPVVAVRHPASIAAVQVGPVNVAEDQLVAGLGQVLDGQVRAVLTVGPHLDRNLSRGLINHWLFVFLKIPSELE